MRYALLWKRCTDNINRDGVFRNDLVAVKNFDLDLILTAERFVVGNENVYPMAVKYFIRCGKPVIIRYRKEQVGIGTRGAPQVIIVNFYTARLGYRNRFYLSYRGVFCKVARKLDFEYVPKAIALALDKCIKKLK